MFTGIIEEIGEIANIRRGEKSAVLTIHANVVLEGTKIGDSIAVNGVCLTVTGLVSGGFTADVMPETMQRTGFSKLKAGSRVNLERAMPANGRFGGHIVSGHIDGTGRILSYRREDNAVWVTIQAKESILSYVVEKGSIAIDGISLTVADVNDTSFRVSIIPHTAAETTLLSGKPGDTVNLETDIIGKYVGKLMRYGGQAKPGQPEEKQGLTMDFLRENGFMTGSGHTSYD